MSEQSRLVVQRLIEGRFQPDNLRSSVLDGFMVNGRFLDRAASAKVFGTSGELDTMDLPGWGTSEWGPAPYAESLIHEAVVLMERGKGPEMATLKKNKVKLTDEERSEVMAAEATWNHGPGGEPTPAVWKAEVKGKTWYVTNTHRAYNVCPTLKGAISRYHKFIKSTA